MVTSEIILSSSHPDAAKWHMNVTIVADEMPGFGGLSGVHAALRQGRDILVVAWDMPFVTPELLGAIVQAGVEHDADAAVPESDSPHRVEPFCAWYAASCRMALSEFLRSGGGSAHRFLERLPRLHLIPKRVTTRFGDPRLLFSSVNTAADLERARAILGSPQ
jgi:molybdopterin-guanine dinucleotide biosynthesis protein A